MKNYDKEIPLISIHIPKCGGSSFKEAVSKWYGKNLYFHYYNEKDGLMPKKIKLKPWHLIGYKENLCIHGHFNHKRGFGVDDYYPEIKQAITFLRDPLETALSVFFYGHKLMKENKSYRNGKKFEIINDIDEFLENRNSYISYFLPKGMNRNNINQYINDYFVHIGVMEHFQKSMDILAEKLNKPIIKIGHENISKRTQEPSKDSINKFKSKCEFEYYLYDRALELNNIT